MARKTWPPIMLTISPDDGYISVEGGQTSIKEQLDPKEFFIMQVGEYTIEIRRRASSQPTTEKRKRIYHDSGKVIKFGK